jgi:hypothetical protein
MINPFGPEERGRRCGPPSLPAVRAGPRKVSVLGDDAAEVLQSTARSRTRLATRTSLSRGNVMSNTPDAPPEVARVGLTARATCTPSGGDHRESSPKGRRTLAGAFTGGRGHIKPNEWDKRAEVDRAPFSVHGLSFVHKQGSLCK